MEGLSLRLVLTKNKKTLLVVGKPHWPPWQSRGLTLTYQRSFVDPLVGFFRRFDARVVPVDCQALIWLETSNAHEPKGTK